jgi:aspartyl-tRNA(Asn)/glutamyl-tRNA(Gln) amidotransferase subunit B
MVTQDILDKYDLTIGIECHVQLKTKTKLFSGTDNDARGREPNAVVSPIDFGLPGMLPVLNREAVTLAIKAGLALNATIAPMSRFDRKHYFYPDLPKGYQISQMYYPTIGPGMVHVPLEQGSFDVRIHHAHIEEDAGKLTHSTGHSSVDLNRAGTPLIEIVSEPDIHSPLEAKAYASELYMLMTYAAVTLGDVNVSCALKGATELGTRAEVKNLNSFRSVERAAQYEFERQVERLEKGLSIVQETRGWDDAKGRTSSQRSKEDAQDYRYMPDADIPPVLITNQEVEAVRADMPMLPARYRDNFTALKLDSTVLVGLIADKANARIVQAILDKADAAAARRTALWLAGATDVDSEQGMIELDVPVDYFIALSAMVDANELNSTAAKDVFMDMSKNPRPPRTIAEDKNLLQNSDESFITDIVASVLADPVSQKAVDDLKAGNEKVIGYLVGQVMKRSQGKANPGLAQAEIRKQLGS